VLSGTGDAAAFLRATARPGAPVTVSTRLVGAAPVEGHAAALSGGPRLLTAGRTTIRAVQEGFGAPGVMSSFVRGRNPRTLAGVTATGRVLLVTVDGRRPGHSVGVTLPEAAGLMRSLGARDALNFDGGGSTTMVVRGRVVNRPSDPGGERPVSSGLLVLP
jgi:exopolysaccharide biosynthesis protein